MRKLLIACVRLIKYITSATKGVTSYFKCVTGTFKCVKDVLKGIILGKMHNLITITFE